ncbi:MAG: hypothetical protein GDA49_00965 [Rhodospirillales bacterium]|nr:hypothetical protein [Rhodospirillales bacterium]
MTIERRKVRLRPHGYQPTKAELEADMSIRRADDSRPTPEEVARVALAQVRIVEESRD